jgi:hypothetical protein
MTPKDKAIQIFYNMSNSIDELLPLDIKKCALIAVDEIILANPHSNPLNTDVYSTMDYWQEVKQEINKFYNHAS